MAQNMLGIILALSLLCWLCSFLVSVFFYLRCKMWEDRVAPDMLGIILALSLLCRPCSCLVSVFYTSGARCGRTEWPQICWGSFCIVSSLLPLLISGVCVFLPQVQDVEDRVAPDMLGIILALSLLCWLCSFLVSVFFYLRCKMWRAGWPQICWGSFCIVSSQLALLIYGVCVFLPQVQDVEDRVAPNMLGIILALSLL